VILALVVVRPLIKKGINLVPKKAVEMRPTNPNLLVIFIYLILTCIYEIRTYAEGFDSCTVHYQIYRDWPTNALSCMLIYLHDCSYMFRQNNSILRELLGSFLSYSSLHNTLAHSSVPYVPWLASYRTDVEVTQKEQLLPEDGIVLPKHVGAIV
jgi:hypothetical protein